MAVIAGTPQRDGTYTATAYAQHGITASGEYVHHHVVAADPAILPIGTRIKIEGAGRYSGEYVVADTGDKIAGRRVDIYLPTVSACRNFGVKHVRVRVIELGNGTRQAAKQADEAVKQHVDEEVQKGAVGSAATEADWAAKGGPVAAAVTGSANPEPTAKSSAKQAKHSSKNTTGSSTANSTSNEPK